MSYVIGDWRPIETAPKDGMVLCGYFARIPVFMAWHEEPPTKRVIKIGTWPFRKSITKMINESGWRVVMLTRGGKYAVHGNYAPFSPTHWMPLPGPPVTP